MFSNSFSKLLIGATIVFAGANMAALAEEFSLRAALSGQNEVPPNDVTASGIAEAAFDGETNTLSWTVNYEGLTGPISGAHIHGPADPSENAGIVVAFENVGTSPFSGSAELSEEQATELLEGRLYVNIHTEAHRGGELRGHLVVTE